MRRDAGNRADFDKCLPRMRRLCGQTTNMVLKEVLLLLSFGFGKSHAASYNWRGTWKLSSSVYYPWYLTGSKYCNEYEVSGRDVECTRYSDAYVVVDCESTHKTFATFDDSASCNSFLNAYSKNKDASVYTYGGVYYSGYTESCTCGDTCDDYMEVYAKIVCTADDETPGWLIAVIVICSLLGCCGCSFFLYLIWKCAQDKNSMQAAPSVNVQGASQMPTAAVVAPKVEMTTPSGMSTIDSIKELGELHRQGVLNDEEFATAKAEVLQRKKSKT